MAAAAPIGALVIYFFLSVAAKDMQIEKLYLVTGILLVFSCGTFLYAATMHVMPEVLKGNGVKNVSTTAQIALMGVCMFLPAFSHMIE